MRDLYVANTDPLHPTARTSLFLSSYIRLTYARSDVAAQRNVLSQVRHKDRRSNGIPNPRPVLSLSLAIRLL